MPKHPQKVATSNISAHSDTRADVVTETAPETDPEVRKGSWFSTEWRNIYMIVPAIIAFATAANSLGNYFASDDLEQVLSNPFIKHLKNLPAAFTSSVWSFTTSDIVFTVDTYFRPIFTSLFTINYALFGTSPLGWHLVNIIIHSAVTVLVFLVVRELTGREWVSGLTAVFFAVHPVHAESVAWISGVTDPLMSLLLLPAFFFYLRFRKGGARYLLAVSLSFFFVALLAKETALALPIVVVGCELFYFDRERGIQHKLIGALKLAALFVLPMVIYFLLRYHALSLVVLAGQARYPLLPALLTIPLATVKYLALMVLPWGYSYQHYTVFVNTVFSWSFLGPMLIIAALVVAIVASKSRDLIFASFWFIALLSPALAALRQFEPANLVQERYLYVPSIGFCLAIALGISWIAERAVFGSNARRIAISLSTVAVIVWAVVLIRQNAVWDDTLSLGRNSIAKTPQTAMTHAVFSRSLYDAGRPRQAEAEARTALALDPQCAMAYMNLSYFARMSGKLDLSIDYLEQGLSAVPEGMLTRHDLATMNLNAGLLYQQQKMPDVGEEKLLRSIEISPRPVAWFYTGQFYFDQGRFEEARSMFELTSSRLPRWFAPIHLRLALTYEALKDLSRAESEYEKYLELAPADAPDRDGVKKHLNDLRVATPKK
jgi:protein O-mannosyl-transferase